MAIVAFGKRFSWEDSLFYQGYEEDEDENYVRILGHRMTGYKYRKPETKAKSDFSLCAGVYLLHAPNGEIVYVGQATQLARRLIAHSGDHLRDRWTHYSWFATTRGQDIATAQRVRKEDEPETGDVSNPEPNLSLNILEAILRTAIEPRLNLRGGNWGDTPMYAQSVEYEFTYLREIYKQNNKIKKILKKLSQEAK